MIELKLNWLIIVKDVDFPPFSSLDSPLPSLISPDSPLNSLFLPLSAAAL